MGISPFYHLQQVNLYLTQTKPYNTVPPRNGGIAGRPDIRADLPIIEPVSFPGYTAESIFQVRRGENLKMFIMVDVGFEATTLKTHGLSTTPFVKVSMGISSFDHLQKVNL